MSRQNETVRDEILVYRDTATGAVYVVGPRGRRGITLRNLASEPGDPDGVVVVSEWILWQSVRSRQWQRLTLG